jgi:hypothetical protein
LDPADQLAARLARDGDPIAIHVEESNVDYAIGWHGRYRIEANLFVYEDSDSSHAITISGYPTRLLLRMTEQMDYQ